MVFGITCRDRVHFGLSLLERDTRFEAADQGQPAAVVIVAVGGFQGQRDHELFVPSIHAARRQNADNRVKIAIDPHGLANHFSIRTKPLPKTVSENRHVFFAGRPFFR